MQVPFMIVTIIALLILGSPVYLALLSGCVVYFVGSPTLSMFMLPQKMINAMDSFTFLAIPFFLIAGQIMNRGGITKRIFHFSDTLVGRFRGGLGYVNILSSFIFSGMSGSALADIGGLGQIEIQAMRESGFDDDFSIGITAASSTIGPIVPPSLPFVTYALFANVSLGNLFEGSIQSLLQQFLGAALSSSVDWRHLGWNGHAYGSSADLRAVQPVRRTFCLQRHYA